uniref:Uncharacterized protein n=1 Tax=Haptolina brevifila TaxID=156173 RepID=A0A7S2D7K5_9EUKA
MSLVNRLTNRLTARGLPVANGKSNFGSKGNSNQAADAVLHHVPAQPGGSATMVHARQASWYGGEDVIVPISSGGCGTGNHMHAVLMTPLSSTEDAASSSSKRARSALRASASTKPDAFAGMVAIIGGYTGSIGSEAMGSSQSHCSTIGRYPALIGQALTLHGLPCLLIEVPAHFAQGAQGEGALAMQADAWRAAAAFAKNALGFCTAIGLAWAAGAQALVTSCCNAELTNPNTPTSVEPSCFSAVVLLNAELDSESDKLACPALLVHGTDNEASAQCAKAFAATNDAELAWLVGAKRNEFMRFGDPTFNELVGRTVDFSASLSRA